LQTPRGAPGIGVDRCMKVGDGKESVALIKKTMVLDFQNGQGGSRYSQNFLGRHANEGLKKNAEGNPAGSQGSIFLRPLERKNLKR